MDFLYDLGLFVAKAFVIVSAILIVLIFAIQMGSSRAHRKLPHLEIEKLNNRFRSFRRQLQGQILGKKKLKSLAKEDKKLAKKDRHEGPRVFVLDFNGDIKASAVASLREEITAILSVAQKGDEVVLRLESGGGLVTSYGLAASQLERVKRAGITLTVCVDKIAASGGYMMACVADRILAAPFAVLGSIGVIAQVPNFNRLLKRADIDYREVTAGEFKRTVTLFGEITEPGLEKFKRQIEDTHGLFKSYVARHRPTLDVSRVGTGEHWYGTQALELGLADEIRTSDDYVFEKSNSAEVFAVHYPQRKPLSERLSDSFGQVLDRKSVV